MQRNEGRVTRLWLMVLATTIALLWPAILNRQPFLFTDTSAYVRGFDAAIYKATGFSTHWTSEKSLSHADGGVARPPRSTDPTVPAAVVMPQTKEAPPVLAGRSIYYGALIYVSDLVDGFWLIAIVQAALVAMAMAMALRQLSDPAGLSNRTKIVSLAIVIFFTPAAYFAGMVMPDVFGGLAVLATASLLFLWGRLDGPPRIFWLLLLAAALLFHSANTLMVAGMTAVGLLAWALRIVRIETRGLVAVIGILVVGLLGEAAFSLAVRKTTGHAPIRPPFVTARLLEDGPGLDYLRRTCPGNGFAVCRYLDRLPLSSDKFLWAGGAGGVFSAVSPAEQRELAAQDTDFSRSVLLDRPVTVLGTTIASVGRQITQSEMRVFNYPPFRVEGYREKLPTDTMAEVAGTKAYSMQMPVRYLEVVTLPLAAVSLAIVGWWAWRSRRRYPQQAAFVAMVAAGFLVNAAIFGALSTPHGRYQNRLIWILPLLAVPLVLRRLEKRAA
jgi:hypothetical protein